MKVERLDLVAMDVKDLDEAARFFSDLFETTFENLDTLLAKDGRKSETTVTEHADRAFEEAPIKLVISPLGIELLQTIPPLEGEGTRAIAFKVSDLEQAKAELKKKGVRLLKEIRAGGFKEAIFSPDDLHGMRLALFEYEAPSIKDAYLQR